MNKSYEKYQQVLSEIPAIDNQIKSLQEIKGRLMSGSIKSAEISIRIETEKKEEPKSEHTFDGLNYGLGGWKLPMFGFGEMTHAVKAIPYISKNYQSSDYLPIDEKTSIGVCDYLIQGLTQRRNVLIASLQNLASVI